MPAVLCKKSRSFHLGQRRYGAVHNAVVLEEVAKMAARTEMINPKVQEAPQELKDKHYYRNTAQTHITVKTINFLRRFYYDYK